MRNTNHIFNKGECLTQEQLNDYINGQMSSAEKNRVEKHLIDCDMCADELEGLSLLKEHNYKKSVSEIENKLFDKYINQDNKKALFIKQTMFAAAGILLFLTIGYIYKATMLDNLDEQLAVNVEDKGKVENEVQVETNKPEMAPELKELETEKEEEIKSLEKPLLKSKTELQSNIKLAEPIPVAASTVVSNEISADLNASYEMEAVTFDFEDEEEEEAEEIALFSISTDESQAAGFAIADDYTEEIDFEMEAEPAVVFEDAELDEAVDKDESDLTVKTDEYKLRSEDKSVDQLEGIAVTKEKATPAPAAAKAKAQKKARVRKASSAKRKKEANRSTNSLALKVENANDLYTNGDYKKAAELFEKNVKQSPEDYSSFYYLGMSYFHLKDYTKAESNLHESLKASSPSFKDEALWHKALCLKENGKLPEYKALLTEIANSESKYKTQAKELLEKE